MNEKEDFLKMMQNMKAKNMLAPLKLFSKLAIVALVAAVFFGNNFF